MPGELECCTAGPMKGARAEAPAMSLRQTGFLQGLAAAEPYIADPKSQCTTEALFLE
jgi:hypothetical protein